MLLGSHDSSVPTTLSHSQVPCTSAAGSSTVCSRQISLAMFAAASTLSALMRYVTHTLPSARTMANRQPLGQLSL